MDKKEIKELIIKMIFTLINLALIAVLTLCIIYSKSIWDNIINIINILAPFIYGGCMAYILVPLCNNIQHRVEKRKSAKLKKYSKIISITITEIIFISIILIICIIIIPQSIISISDIVKSFPSALDNTQKLIDEKILTNKLISDIFGDKLENIENTIMTLIKNEITPNIQLIFTSVLSSATSVGKVLIDIIMALFISIFALASRENFAAYMKKFIKAVFGNKISKLILEEINIANKMFSGFFFGKIVDSLIIGILCFIVLTILNIPYALLVSVIVGITNIIPIAGPFIGAIPGIIIIFSASPIQSLYFLIIILLIQQLDGNIIGPKCIGNATNLSTFWVLFAILFFGGLWGIIGMVIGVPLLAVIFDIINKIINRLLEKRGIEQNSKEDNN